MLPAPVLLVIFIFVVLAPLGSWAMANLHDWAVGDSPAGMLVSPYFWGVLLARLGGAFILAGLLWFFRNPASIWITVTSVWLAGPPFQMLLSGIVILAASAGQRSLPGAPMSTMILSCTGPAVVTVLLLAFRSSRRAYGVGFAVRVGDP